MSDDPDQSLARLLAEEPFVRALARALAVDGDEVVQRTWLRAMGARPLDLRQPRSWLQRVVRNVAANLRRGERRRGDRERAAAKPERVPSSAELMAREERRRALVAAVDRLPAELRSVVLLRFFEGLPPRRIAKELALPVATVWNQLRRALQLLRRQLDREHGDRRAWLWPLCAARPDMAGPWWPAVEVTGGAIAMTTTKGKVLAGLVVLCALAFAVPLAPLLSRPADAPPKAAPLDVGAAAAGGTEAQPPLAGDAQSTQRQSVAATAQATTGTLIVRARHEDDGSPAAGLVLSVRELAVQTPFGGRLVHTDRDGVARLAVEPGEVRVHAQQGQREVAATVEAGATVLLDYQLPVGITVRGVVVDRAGHPIGGAEVVMETFSHFAVGVVATTAADGTFELRGCTDDGFVGARAAGYAAPWLQMLRNTAGSTVNLRIEMTDAGGGVAGRVFDPTGAPVADAVVQVGPWSFDGMVTSLGLSPITPRVRTDAEGCFACSGLAVGEHAVTVRSAGFAPWSGSCLVAAGGTTSLTVRLGPGVRCVGVVRDSAGAVVAEAAVAVDLGDAGSCMTFSKADGTFVLAGLPAGEWQVRSEHDRAGKATERVVGVAGEVATCALVLSRGLELRGRVLDEGGAPVTRAFASARVGRNTVDGVFADGDGRFALGFCSPGPVLEVSVEASGFADWRQRQVDAAAGELVVRLARNAEGGPPSVHIAGVVVGPDGAPIADAQVTVVRQGGGLRVDGKADALGRFRLGPLPAGQWSVSAYDARYPYTGAGPQPVLANATWDVGELRFVEGGRLRVEVAGAGTNKLKTCFVDARGRHLGYRFVGATVIESDVNVAGEYRVAVWCDGCAPVVLPAAIVPGQVTRLQAALQPGVRQRFAFAAADGTADFREVHYEVLQGGALQLCRPFGEPQGADAEVWLRPGDYEIEATDWQLRGRATFTVGTTEAVPLVVTLR